MCSGVVHVLPVSRLTLFDGSRELAERLALEDAEQDVIEDIDGWKGDPAQQFYVKLRRNEDYIWEPWSQVFSESVPFEQFCSRYDMLQPLLITTAEVRLEASALNRLPIVMVAPGDTVYVSLRYFDYYLYDNGLDLPNKFSIDYVVRVKYTGWEKEDHSQITAVIPIFGDAPYWFTHWFVKVYGSRQILLPAMQEITVDTFRLFPNARLLDFVPLHLQGLAQRKIQRALHPQQSQRRRRR